MTRMQQVWEKAALYGIWTGIVLILLTPFVVTPDTIFPFVVGKAVYSRSLIECVFGVWAILALFRPAYRPPRSRLLLLLAVSVGVSILAACFGVSPQRSFWSTYERMQGVVDLIHWFAFAVVLASVLRTDRDWRVVLNINVGVSLVMAGLTIFLYYLGDVSFFSYEPDYRFVAVNARFGIDAQGRVHATLGNPLYLGGYLLMNGMIALGFLFRSFTQSTSLLVDSLSQREGEQKTTFPQSNRAHNRLKDWVRRCFWGGAILTTSWGAFLTGSRSVVLGLVTSMAFFWTVFLLSPIRVPRLVITGCIGIIFIVGLVTAATFWSTGPFENNLTTRSLALIEKVGGRRDYRSRVELWKAGIRGFVERSSLGWGPENYIMIFGRHASEYSHQMGDHDHSHNRLVEELSTKGIIGMMTYLVLLMQTFLVIGRAVASQDQRDIIIPLCICAALIGYFVWEQFSVGSASVFLQYILFLGFVTHLETGGKRPPTVDRRGCLSPSNRIRVVIAAGILIVVGTGMHANQAIYSATTSLKMASDRTNHPGQSMAHIVQAITQFKPLANVSRNILFNSAPEFWKNLRGRHRPEAERLLTLLDNEGVASIAHESGNWQVYRNLARIYILVSEFDPKYEDRARWYANRARELAPHCIIWSSLPSAQ